MSYQIADFAEKSLAQLLRETIKLANEKHFYEALDVATLAMERYNNLHWINRTLFDLTNRRHIELLDQGLERWQKVIYLTDALSQRAKNYEECAQENISISDWTVALKIYEICNREVFKEAFQDAQIRCQSNLKKTQIFWKLYDQANGWFEQRYFTKAYSIYLQAQALFEIPNLLVAMKKCQEMMSIERQYENTLLDANESAISGDFQRAYQKVTIAYQDFPRSDGDRYRVKLESAIKIQNPMQSALIAEKQEDWQSAIQIYKEILQLAPSFREAQFRLIVVYLKCTQIDEAKHGMASLTSSSEEQRLSYLAGFALASEKYFQQAHQKWLDIDEAKSQRSVLTKIEKWEQAIHQQEIECSVNNGNLSKARELSIQFIEIFGDQAGVLRNLKEHIEPRIENEIWASSDWELLSQKSEIAWLDHQDIASLHNWAVACLNRVKSQEDFANFASDVLLEDCITSNMTALANLGCNPSLHKVTWLDVNENVLSDLFESVTSLIETYLELAKKNSLEQYLRLRDLYRLDSVALKLIRECKQQGATCKGLTLLPSCINRYRNELSDLILPCEVSIHTLYSTWGLAVAACLEGDIERALEIQPKQDPILLEEIWGHKLIMFYKGIFLLSQGDWNEAFETFHVAKDLIQEKEEWLNQIDKLCAEQRKQLNRTEGGEKEEITLNLQFGNYWFDLLKSHASKTNLVEVNVESIRFQIAKDSLSLKKGLEKLSDLKKIDAEVPILIDLIERIETAIEIDDIFRMIRSNRIEAAVGKAKYSSNGAVRLKVAEFLIEILIEGSHRNNLAPTEIFEIGRWAYEICPNESAFRPIYEQLGFC